MEIPASGSRIPSLGTHCCFLVSQQEIGMSRGRGEITRPLWWTAGNVSYKLEAGPNIWELKQTSQQERLSYSSDSINPLKHRYLWDREKIVGHAVRGKELHASHWRLPWMWRRSTYVISNCRRQVYGGEKSHWPLFSKTLQQMTKAPLFFKAHWTPGYLFSAENFLSIFGLLPFWVVCLFLIPDVNSLSVIWAAIAFSHSVACFFTAFVVLFYI